MNSLNSIDLIDSPDSLASPEILVCTHCGWLLTGEEVEMIDDAIAEHVDCKGRCRLSRTPPRSRLEGLGIGADVEVITMDVIAVPVDDPVVIQDDGSGNQITASGRVLR